MVLFDILQPFYLSEHPIDIGMTANADFIALEVLVNDVMIGARLHVPPTDNKASIDIKSMIHAELIKLNNSIVSLEEDIRIRKPVECKVRGATVIGGSTGAFTDSPTFKVVLGKVERHTATFYQDFSTSQAFLTSYPNRQKVGIDQPQFLTYFCHTALATGELRVVSSATYEDGSRVVQSIQITETLELYDMVVMNVQPSRFGHSLDNMVSYQIYMQFTPEGGTASTISEYRQFLIQSTHDHWRDILYFNEYYAPHTLRLTGSWTNQLQTDYLRMQTESGINQTTQDDKELIRAKSGFMSKDESIALKGLYRRGKLWWIDGEYATLMVLEKKKWLVSSSFKFLYVIDLAMIASNDGDVYAGKALSVNGVVNIPTDGGTPDTPDTPDNPIE